MAKKPPKNPRNKLVGLGRGGSLLASKSINFMTSSNVEFLKNNNEQLCNEILQYRAVHMLIFF